MRPGLLGLFLCPEPPLGLGKEYGRVRGYSIQHGRYGMGYYKRPVKKQKQKQKQKAGCGNPKCSCTGKPNFRADARMSTCDLCGRGQGKHRRTCPQRAAQSQSSVRDIEIARERRELELDEDFGAGYTDAHANTFTDYAPARLANVKGLQPHPDP
eukprot:3229396-Rhodomonas_salina.1